MIPSYRTMSDEVFDHAVTHHPSKAEGMRRLLEDLYHPDLAAKLRDTMAAAEEEEAGDRWDGLE